MVVFAKPYPVTAGSSTSWGISTYEPNIAKPIANAVRFVDHTGRRDMSCMSTIGSGTRRSHAMKAVPRTAAAANSPSTPVDFQPHALPCETPSRSEASASDSSAAPSQSILAFTRTGDSGTKRHVAHAATAVTASEDQKIHSIERWSTITPASTRPSPPPMPKVAEIRPIEVATRSGGNSSRMIPKASGKIAPPAPWIPRPRISTPIDPPIAHTKEPRAKMPSAMSSTFSLPYMSPKRPSSGVETLDVSRKAVSSQVAPSGEAPRSCWMAGSAGMIIVWASA